MSTSLAVRSASAGTGCQDMREEQTMGKKNRKGNREPRKPKQVKLALAAATTIAELSRQQAVGKRRLAR